MVSISRIWRLPQQGLKRVSHLSTPHRLRTRAFLGIAASLALHACGIPVGSVASLEDRVETRPVMARRGARATTDTLLVLATDIGGAASGAPGLVDRPMGGLPAVLVGSDGESTRWRGFLGFGLEAVPARAHVESAHLALTPGQPSGEASVGMVRAVAVGGRWQGTALSWSSQPPLRDAITAEAQVIARKPIRIDVTPLVRAWVTGQAPNHGLALDAARPDEPFWISFVGLDEDETRVPRLEISYTWSPPEGDESP